MTGKTPHYAETWATQNPAGCPICGLAYVEASPDDRRRHRTYHQKIVRTYEPEADEALAALCREHGTFVPVRMAFETAAQSPCTIWRERSGASLIVSSDGRAIGGLGVNWCEFSDAPARWMWSWVWVIPSERRRGHVKHCWAMLKDRFTGIEPEPPFSYPVAKFFSDRTDVRDWVGKRARSMITQHLTDTAA